MSNLTTRSRKLEYALGRGVTTTYDSEEFGAKRGQITTRVTTADHLTSGKQVTASEGHPFAGRSKSDLADIGGEFYTTKQYVRSSQKKITLAQSVNGYPQPGGTKCTYNGPVLPVAPNSVGYPPTGESTSSVLNQLGATAIARCKPTNSVADAATFLGELYREGLPSLIGSSSWVGSTYTAKQAGSEYLNAQFGWRPLISDVSKFLQGVIHANAVMRQYERDAGKVVRRKYYFPVQRSKTEQVLGVNQTAYIAPFNTLLQGGGTGTLVLTRETVKRQWFAGAFTYHLPFGYDSRSRMQRYALEAEKVFGLSLTPDTLWNLAPWSWAVDWFSNTGDVISNLTDWATDCLVLRYGYMMEHTIVKDTYTITSSNLVGLKSRVPPLVFVTETKIRKRATPYGFGVDLKALSAFQLSIIAALGLSR